MLTISPFLVIDDNSNINNERARKIKQEQTQENSKKRTKELNGSNECTYPRTNTKCDTKHQSPDNYELSLTLPSP
jgi:hypothetical protein